MESNNSHAVDHLIFRVRKRDRGKEKYVYRFIKEWIRWIDKVPITELHQIEQSVKFVWSNENGIDSPSGTDYQKYILKEEIEEFIEDLKTGTKEEIENDKR